MNKKIVGLGLASVAVLGLAACGNRSNSSSSSDAATKVAMVTDVGGVDDRSFNQSAWEGLQDWGKEAGLSKDNGYTYYQSSSGSDYVTNLEQAVTDGYNVVFGIGFALHDAVEEVASSNTDTNFVIIDDVIDGLDNVASVTFADNEAAYLAGVAAAKTTKTNNVGFIGGVEGEVIKRFEAGFVAGVKSVDEEIEVQVQYANDFGDAAKGKTIAAAQYAAGADVIYQAAGGTGTGVFNEAKSENETRNEEDKVWVIGVDRDQSAEGDYTSKDKKDSNFVLASTLKEVGATLKLIAESAAEGSFEGGATTRYGLKDGGVDLAVTNLSEEAQKAVEEAKEAILSGDVEVPEK